MTTDPSRPFLGVRVLAISAFDSFLRTVSFFGARLAEGGAQVEHVLAKLRRDQLSLRQARECGLSAIPESAPLPALHSAALLRAYDLVLLGLSTSGCRAFLAGLMASLETSPQTPRPLIACAFPGLLFRQQLESMAGRMAADVLLLSSPADLALYQALCRATGQRSDNALLAGYATVPRRAAHSPPRRDGAIVFAGQPTVPLRRADRLFLIERLCVLAERFPDRELILKPRHARHESTLHQETDHAEDLLVELARRRRLPSNLRVSHEPLEALFARASLCLTVSSTAALQAVQMGVPTRIVRDLGVHEELGNHFFLGSSLLASLDELSSEPAFVIDESWREAHVCSAEERWPDVAHALSDALSRRREHGAPALRREQLGGVAESYAAFLQEREDASPYGPLMTLRRRLARDAERLGSWLRGRDG